MLAPTKVTKPRKRPKKELSESAVNSYWLASDLFWRDLEANLGHYFGRWVAYSATGLFHVGESSHDDLAVYRQCLSKGLKRGDFFVGHVVPDLPTEQIPDDWFCK